MFQHVLELVQTERTLQTLLFESHQKHVLQPAGSLLDEGRYCFVERTVPDAFGDVGKGLGQRIVEAYAAGGQLPLFFVFDFVDKKTKCIQKYSHFGGSKLYCLR